MMDFDVCREEEWGVVDMDVRYRGGGYEMRFASGLTG